MTQTQKYHVRRIFNKCCGSCITKTYICTSDAPPGTSLRLHDVYQNAFHRVVEMCLLDSKADYSPLQSDEIWLNFLDWEQGIRRNLTQELWKQNPAELVGEWELVDVSGLGSLNSIMTAPAEMFFTDTAPGVKCCIFKLLFVQNPIIPRSTMLIFILAILY